ncbi:hypothetical protein B0H34DRAFT_801647 [Crassisporium funariophilum]|nr:hypothetical protein B0H34DRAFT_801647 [Crassisporium funariophilum]
MSMRPLGQRLFTDESVSLRSFRVNAMSPSPPSLKASSLKIRSSLAFSNLLGSRGRAGPSSSQKPFEPRLQDLVRTSEGSDFGMGLPPSSSDSPNAAENNSPAVETEQSTAQRPRSKSRTIIRMLTTKFNPRAPSSNSSPPAVRRLSIGKPPVAANAYGKEQRDAALRARGLLPPLRPNKDLSTQEMEQDQAIPILVPVDELSTHAEEALPSAADLIKKEWENKNRSVEVTQRQRMNSFKFGGPPSPIMGSPSEEKELSLKEPSTSRIDPVDPVPDPDNQVSPSRNALHPVPPSSAEDVALQPTLPARASSETPVVSSPTRPDIELSIRPMTPLIELSPEMNAFMFGTPASPSLSKCEVEDSDSGFGQCSPTAVALPPSPSLRSLPVTPVSLKSSAGASGACTPRAGDPRETSVTPTPPEPPVISLTPPAAFSSPTATDDSISSAFHTRTDSFAQLEESVSSILTPSLSSNSHSTTASTLGTVESLSSSGKGKLGGLKVKTHEGSNIPIIIESPIEDRFSVERSVIVEEEVIDEKTAPVVESIAPLNLRMKKRGVTDPAANVDRRKSLNPFKRGQTEASENNSDSTPKRMSSVGSSLANMRRSVVGTLSKKSMGGGGDVHHGSGKMFNASHLPPSPTMPMSPVGSRVAATRRQPVIRQAVAPTVYSRGSILLEASNIEDDETRRMTEMAFLN